MTALPVRRLTGPADLLAAYHLGRRTFGGPAEPPAGALADDAMDRWGVHDGGVLVGKATDLHHGQWWGGRVLPAADIGGVAMPPERRGGGLARQVLTHLLARARDRGALVSTLYPTTTGPYRAMGWEVTGTLRWVDLPTAALRSVPAPAGPTALRAATAADWPAVQAVYAQVAALGEGPLSREGPGFERPGPDGRLPFDGITLVEQDGVVTGYASWQRGHGYGVQPDHAEGGALLTVPDLLATTADAARALARSLAGWDTVTPTVRYLPLPWAEPVGLTLPVEQGRQFAGHVWMWRPVEVAGAVAARGWPSTAEGSLTFVLTDAAAPWNAGPWRLSVRAGSGALTRPLPADPAGPTLDVRGFALLWCGTATPAQVRAAGLLHGDAGQDGALAATLGAGRTAALLDYF